MNWGRAKVRLILLFFCVNLLLGWENYKKEFGMYTLKEIQVSDIKNLLKENNIIVDCAVPKDYTPLQKLTVLPYEFNSSVREKMAGQILHTLEDVTVSLEQPKLPGQKPKRIYRKQDEWVIFEGENVLYRNDGIADEKSNITMNEAKKIAEKWLKQMGYYPKKMYMQVKQQSEYIEIVYYDKYKNMPIFDSYVKMKVVTSGIMEAKIHKVQLGELVGNEENIYSADQVFLYLMNTIDKKQPIHIKDIVIGYALENPKGAHLIAEEAIPFYQIMLTSGEIYYINAYTNEIKEKNPL